LPNQGQRLPIFGQFVEAIVSMDDDFQPIHAKTTTMD
jgi:hypothetical protein